MKTRISSLKKHTDAELIKLYLEGSQNAFTALEAKHSFWLSEFALRLVSSTADAKDVVQNAWEKGHRKFMNGGYHETGRFKEWMGTLLYHEAADWLKKRRRHGMTFTVEKAQEDITPLISSFKDMRHSGLLWAIQTLSAKAQTIIDLHFFKKMTFKEIARVLNLTVGAVTNAYSRALKKLRKLMRIEKEFHAPN